MDACGEDLRSAVDVADIGGDTRGPSDIVEGEPGDQRVELHQQSQRLPDTPGGAENGDLALRDGFGGVATSSDVGRGASRYGGLHGSEHGRPHFWEESGGSEKRKEK